MSCVTAWELKKISILVYSRVVLVGSEMMLVVGSKVLLGHSEAVLAHTESKLVSAEIVPVVSEVLLSSGSARGGAFQQCGPCSIGRTQCLGIELG